MLPFKAGKEKTHKGEKQKSSQSVNGRNNGCCSAILQLTSPAVAGSQKRRAWSKFAPYFCPENFIIGFVPRGLCYSFISLECSTRFLRVRIDSREKRREKNLSPFLLLPPRCTHNTIHIHIQFIMHYPICRCLIIGIAHISSTISKINRKPLFRIQVCF